jgi:hypothetical protein
MAGTMPHAIFVETGLDGGATVAAYAAELPGCATFAPSDGEATAAIPARVRRFTEWLRTNGESVPQVVGDNWYEVERAAAGADPAGRATFSLDELPPSDDEWIRWGGWLELAREELAEAMDARGLTALAEDPLFAAILAQDAALVAGLGAPPAATSADPIDRFYATRDALFAALDASGPSGLGVRRALRLTIADDLRLADRLRGGEG